MQDETTIAAQRDRARDLLAYSLAIPTGNADQELRQLSDDEVAEICNSSGEQRQRREQIKTVLARAYDRRRDEAAAAARKTIADAGKVIGGIVGNKPIEPSEGDPSEPPADEPAESEPPA